MRVMTGVSETAMRAGNRLNKRTAALITVALVCAAAEYYVPMTTAPGSDMYVYRLLSPVICIGLVAAAALAERLSGVRLSDTTAALTRLLIAACVVLGRSFALYDVPGYDKLLHTASGAVFTLIGTEVAGAKGAKHAVLCGVLLALASGYLWELFEFAGDALFGLNSQRWAENVIAHLPDRGGWLVRDPRGSAIVDTMGDMFVNLFGSAVCAALQTGRTAFAAESPPL